MSVPASSNKLGHVGLEGGWWIIPSAKAKNKLPHRVAEIVHGQEEGKVVPFARVGVVAEFRDGYATIKIAH